MLKTLQADGFKLLDDFKADFGALTVVVGANASGKSTLLDCLRFISELSTFSFREALDWHGGLYSLRNASSGKAEIKISVTFDKSGNEPWSWLSADGLLEYAIAFKEQLPGQILPVSEILRYLPSDKNGIPEKILLRSGPDGSFVYDLKKGTLSPFDQAVMPAGQTVTDDYLAKLQMSEPGFRLSQMRFPNDYPIQSIARLALSAFRGYPSFDVSASSSVRTKLAEIRSETFLQYNGENLGNVLHEVLTRYQYKSIADELRAFLRSAYPQFEEITAETAYGGGPARVLVRVHEKGMKRPMDLWDLSDGMLRFLCLAAALLSSTTCSVVAIDEPEAGLHPRLMPIVADMIKAASERTQVLITTHSPDLLNQFSIDDVAVITREDAKAKWERPGNRQSLKRMLENVTGDSLADLHRSGELEALQQ